MHNDVQKTETKMISFIHKDVSDKPKKKMLSQFFCTIKLSMRMKTSDK